MKRNLLFLILLASSILVFTGCEKDDKGSAIDGTWHLQKDIDKYYVNGVIQSDETTSYAKGDYSITFSEGKFTSLDNGDDDGSGTFVYANNTLILTYKDGSETIVDTKKVKELTSSSLVILSEDEYTQQGSTFKYVYESFYTK